MGVEDFLCTLNLIVSPNYSFSLVNLKISMGATGKTATVIVKVLLLYFLSFILVACLKEEDIWLLVITYFAYKKDVRRSLLLSKKVMMVGFCLTFMTFSTLYWAEQHVTSGLAA